MIVDDEAFCRRVVGRFETATIGGGENDGRSDLLQKDRFDHVRRLQWVKRSNEVRRLSETNVTAMRPEG